MNEATAHALKKQELRLRLQANRLLMAQNNTALFTVDGGGFPRSLTMRLLSNKSGILTFLAGEVAPFLIGRYLASRKFKQSNE